jgi:hypothetical protein
VKHAQADGLGRVGLPAVTLARVGRPQVAAVRALQMDQRAPVAQEVLPVRGAICCALAVAAAAVGIAGRAGQPGTSARIGGWVNR